MWQGTFVYPTEPKYEESRGKCSDRKTSILASKRHANDTFSEGVPIWHPPPKGVSIWHPFTRRGLNLAPLIRARGFNLAPLYEQGFQFGTPSGTQWHASDTHWHAPSPLVFPRVVTTGRSTNQPRHQACGKQPPVWATRSQQIPVFFETLCHILYSCEPSWNCDTPKHWLELFPGEPINIYVFDRSMIDLSEHQAALSKSEWSFLLARSRSSIEMKAHHTCNPCWLGSQWCIHSLDFMGWDLKLLKLPKFFVPSKLPDAQVTACWLESPPQLFVEKEWERVQYQPSSSVRCFFKPGIQQLKHMRSWATTFKMFWIGRLAILKVEAAKIFSPEPELQNMVVPTVHRLGWSIKSQALQMIYFVGNLLFFWLGTQFVVGLGGTCLPPNMLYFGTSSCAQFNFIMALEFHSSIWLKLPPPSFVGAF